MFGYLPLCTVLCTAHIRVHKLQFLVCKTMETGQFTVLVSLNHRLNMDLDLQSLFGLHMHSLRESRPRPPPRIWAHIRGRYWSAKIDDISLLPPGLNKPGASSKMKVGSGITHITYLLCPPFNTRTWLELVPTCSETRSWSVARWGRVRVRFRSASVGLNIWL